MPSDPCVFGRLDETWPYPALYTRSWRARRIAVDRQYANLIGGFSPATGGNHYLTGMQVFPISPALAFRALAVAAWIFAVIGELAGDYLGRHAQFGGGYRRHYLASPVATRTFCWAYAHHPVRGMVGGCLAASRHLFTSPGSGSSKCSFPLCPGHRVGASERPPGRPCWNLREHISYGFRPAGKDVIRDMR